MGRRGLHAIAAAAAAAAAATAMEHDEIEMLPTANATVARTASIPSSAAVPLLSGRCPRTFDDDGEVTEFVLARW